MQIINQYKDYLIRNGHSSMIYAYLAKKFSQKCPLEILSQETVDNYMTEITKAYEPAYVNLMHGAIRSFFRFLEKDFKVPKDLKVPKKLIASLPMTYVENTILPAVDSINFASPYKVKAIIYLLAYTGMRKSEIPLLKRADINTTRGELKVYLKKTKKEKIMLFPQKVSYLLDNYFSTDQEITNAFNIGVSGVDNIFLKLKNHFGDSVHLHPHLFKKIAVTHLHNKCGFSLKEVSEMVGVSVQTLEKHYLDIDMDKIKESYQRRIK